MREPLPTPRPRWDVAGTVLALAIAFGLAPSLAIASWLPGTVPLPVALGVGALAGLVLPAYLAVRATSWMRRRGIKFGVQKVAGFLLLVLLQGGPLFAALRWGGKGVNDLLAIYQRGIELVARPKAPGAVPAPPPGSGPASPAGAGACANAALVGTWNNTQRLPVLDLQAGGHGTFLGDPITWTCTDTKLEFQAQGGPSTSAPYTLAANGLTLELEPGKPLALIRAGAVEPELPLFDASFTLTPDEGGALLGRVDLHREHPEDAVVRLNGEVIPADPDSPAAHPVKLAGLQPGARVILMVTHRGEVGSSDVSCPKSFEITSPAPELDAEPGQKIEVSWRGSLGEPVDRGVFGKSEAKVLLAGYVDEGTMDGDSVAIAVPGPSDSRVELVAKPTFAERYQAQVSAVGALGTGKNGVAYCQLSRRIVFGRKR